MSAGQVLIVLDTTELEREMRSKQLAYDNALADVGREQTKLDILRKSNETQISQSQAELDYNRSELDRARTELEKQKRLADEKLVPRYNVDEAELKVASAELAVKKGTMALELKREEVASNEEQQKAEVRNKENAAAMAGIELEDVKSRIQQAVVTSPASGLVVLKKTWVGPGERRKFKEGDSPYRGQTICDIPDLASMQALVQVGESDAPRVRVGIPALIRLEAVPNKEYHGTVTDISSLATEASPWETSTTPGRKNFEVTVAIKEVDPTTLKPGMTADVEFIIATVDDALYIPIEAVQERAGKTYVYVKQGSRWVRIQVSTGRSNDNAICIIRGLRQGQVVALRDPTTPLEQQEAGATASDQTGGNGRRAAPIPGAE